MRTQAIVLGLCVLGSGADSGASCPLGDRSRFLVPLVQGTGQPTVVGFFDGDTLEVIDVLEPYQASEATALRIASGDVDGVDEVIVAPGSGGGPHVRVINASPIQGIGAIDRTDSFGVFVASGDVSGDGFDDIILGTGAGGGPHVRVFSGTDYIGEVTPLVDTEVFDSGFTGGVRVATGDVNGDGTDDIIVGTGPGTPAHVTILDAGLTYQRDIVPFGTNFTGGVYIAAGDVDADGMADVVIAAGGSLDPAGGGPHVIVFSGRSIHEEDMTPPRALLSISPYATEPAEGQSVAVRDVDGDGRADIITGAGAGGGPHIKVFSGASGAEIRDLRLDDFSAGAAVEVATTNTTLVFCSDYE